MSDPFSSSDNGGSSEVEDEENSVNGLEGQLRTGLNTDNLETLQLPAIRNGIEDVEDEDLLKEAYETDGREQAQDLYRERLSDLGVSLEEESEEDPEAETEVTTDMTESQIDVSSIAPNAMSSEEAKENEHLWRVMVWGPPGVGKTHFAYTMPGPVCIIDTEGKADDIAHKFDKDFFVWKPQGYDEARESLAEALDVLEEYQSRVGETGTLVVDSMSIMWNWSQEKYSQEYYGQSADDTEFDSGFGGGQSDWQKIKRYHNEKFRRPMIESDFHLCWTAMSKKDYGAMLRESLDDTPDKPDGEKNNIYKVDHIVHIRQNDTGVPVAELEKSGLIKYRFEGLEYPTHGKIDEIVDDIDEAERSDTPVDVEEVTDYDVSVVKGNPRFVRRKNE